MKITELIAQLEILRGRYGNLSCVVDAESGIEPIRQPVARVLQDFDFGTLDSLKTGERVAVVWTRPAAF